MGRRVGRESLARRFILALSAGTLVLAACATEPSVPSRSAPTRGAVAPAPVASKVSAEKPPPPLLVRDARIPFDATPLSEPSKPVVTAPALRRLAYAPRARGYALPLRAAQVKNFSRDVEAKTSLWDAAEVRAPLFLQGMVVIDSEGATERFGDAYRLLSSNGVPVMVTADSLLHLYHVYFDQILQVVELEELSPMLRTLLAATYDELIRLAADAGGKLREPALMAVSYLSVARALLEPEFSPHPEVAARVAADVKRLLAHEQLDTSNAMSHTGCVGPDCYQEDFSQYVPRGHYAASPELQRYFRASMWLGRIAFRFAIPDEVVGQTLLLQALARTRLTFRGDELTAAELLSRIDRVLDYFVGETDDLGVFDIQPALLRKLEKGRDLRSLAEPGPLEDLTAELRKLRAPRILSNAVPIGLLGEDAQATLKRATQGFRLLGQRYAADSDLLGRLVFEFTGPNPRHPRFAETAESVKQQPEDDSLLCTGLTPEERAALDHPSCEKLTVRLSRCLCQRAIELHKRCVEDATCRAGHPEAKNQAFSQVCRLMPSGLDVAAVLGSARAEAESRPAASYCHYGERRREQSARWQKAPADTLYADWLGVLRPLLARPGAGYPTWVRGSAYQDKSLTTALAAWSEARHDTILYVKQSYTEHLIVVTAGNAPLFEPGFYATVEPAPDVIAGLERLSAKTRGVLGALGVLPKGVESSLGEMEGVLARLFGILEKQLSETPRDQDDTSFLMSIGDTFDGLTKNLAATPPPAPDPKAPSGSIPTPKVEGMDEATRTTLVADVHTDLNTRRVLEEAVGPIRWLLVVTHSPDGALSVSVGPVFSHYEFVHRLDDRLTDEKWRALLKQRAVAPRSVRPLANGFERPCTPETCRGVVSP